MVRFLLAVCLVGGLFSLACADTVIVNETFEGFADDTALKVQWVPSVLPDNGYLITEADNSTAFPAPGKGVEHIGGNVMAWATPFEISPSETQSVVVEGDIFDTGATGNKRMSIGLRSSSPTGNLIEMGFWNSNDGTPFAGSPDVIGFAYRIQLFGVVAPNVNPNWQFFELDSSLDRANDLDTIVNEGDVGEAWHRYRATITPASITLQLDLYRDGLINVGGTFPEDFNGDGTVGADDYTIWRDNFGLIGAATKATGDADGDLDVTQTDFDLWKAAFGMSIGEPQPGWDATVVIDTVFPIFTEPNGAFDSLRIGGPSGLSSAGGGVIFDNVSLSLVDVPLLGAAAVGVPEPATMTLLMGTALVLSAGTRRRRA